MQQCSCVTDTSLGACLPLLYPEDGGSMLDIGYLTCVFYVTLTVNSLHLLYQPAHALIQRIAHECILISA
jgi:hypothetical protein